MRTIKTILLFVTIALSQQLKAEGISMDTLRTNEHNAITISFSEDEEVEFCTIAGNPYKVVNDYIDYKYYQISIMGSMVLIEVKNQKKEYSTIAIKTNKKVYYGYIIYSNEVKRSFYDYTIKKTNTEQPSEIKDQVEQYHIESDEVTEEKMNSRIEKVISMKNDYEEIADIKGEVVFQVGAIANDHKYTYIKLIVQNNSSTTYKVNGIFFRFAESKKKTGKNDAVNAEWINATKVIYPTNREIKAYTHDVIGFVVPLYNGDNGTVMLKVIEDNGTRTAVLNIKSKVINTTKIF